MANTNDIGLGWGEENQYGGGGGMDITEDGGINFNFQGDEFGGGGFFQWRWTA